MSAYDQITIPVVPPVPPQYMPRELDKNSDDILTALGRVRDSVTEAPPSDRAVASPNSTAVVAPARVLTFQEELEDGVDIRRLVGSSQTADQRATLQANLDTLLSTVAIYQRTRPVVLKCKGNAQRMTFSGDISISQWYVHLEGAGLEWYFETGGLKFTRTTPNFTISNEISNLWIRGSGKGVHTGTLLDLVTAPKTLIRGGALIEGETGLAVRGTVGSNINLQRIENMGLWGIREEPVEIYLTVSGTITASTGSTAVTGSGTAFLSQLFAGCNLFNGAGTYLGRVSSVTNNNSLTLVNNSTTAVTGGAYQAALIAESQGNTISCGAIQGCGVKTGGSSTWPGGALRQIGGIGSKIVPPFDMETNARGIVSVNVGLSEYSHGYAELNSDLGDIWIGQSGDASIPITLTSAESRLIPTGRNSEANSLIGFKTGGQVDPGTVKAIVVGTTTDLVVGTGQFSAAIEFKNAASNAVIMPQARLIGGIINSVGARVYQLYSASTGLASRASTTGQAEFRNENADGTATASSGFTAVTSAANVFSQFLVHNGSGGTPYAMHNGGSAVTIAYADFDTHIWRANASAEKGRLDTSGLKLPTGRSFYVNNVQVVSARQTGFSAITGTASKSTFATGTATLTQVAERLKAIDDALRTHGLID